MGGTGIFTSVKRRKERESRKNFPVSSFTITLLILGFFFWYYCLLTFLQASNCALAVSWVSGWFDYRAPLQLFAAAFALVFIIWVIRLVAYRRRLNVVETVLQGFFIVGFMVSLAFVKALVLPYATPSHKQMHFIADLVSPVPELLVQEYVSIYGVEDRPPWPYDFPPPPSYPYHYEWVAGDNTDLAEIFTSTHSPTYKEYNEMLECAVRFNMRLKDHERALADYEEWHDQYEWRVEDKYLRYKWD